MSSLLRILVSVLIWGIGVLLPAFLVVSGRRAVAVAVLGLLAVLLLVGWRWRAFLWWAIAGITGGVGFGLLSGWLLVFAGRTGVDDPSAVILLLTLPVGIGVGLVLAGAAFRRWDPSAESKVERI
jgi:hypothetical protein